MKKAAEFTRKIKQLYTKLKKDGGKASLEIMDDPMHILLMGVLCNYAGEQRSAAALRKLLESAVDMNELRVTPVADIVQDIGADFPSVRQAANEISFVLNSVFNALHHLDISFLKSQSKKAVNAFLERVDGLTPHGAAYFRNRYLGHGDVPLDANMLSHLERSGCLPPDASAEDAHKFVSNIFGDRDAANFYALFKRYAAAHASRRPTRRADPSTATERSMRSPDSEAAPARSADGTRKKKESTRRKTGSRKPSAARPRGKTASSAKRKPAKSKSARVASGKSRAKS